MIGWMGYAVIGFIIEVHGVWIRGIDLQLSEFGLECSTFALYTSPGFQMVKAGSLYVASLQFEVLLLKLEYFHVMLD